MEAAVLVGVRTLVNKDCQAPGEPEEPVPQGAPAPDTNPLVSAFRHWVEPVIVFKVNAPATVTGPFRRVVPSAPNVVVGTAVPTPTLPSLTFITKELLNPTVVVALMIVEVAIATPKPSAGVSLATLKCWATRRLLSIVELPLTKMPAAVFVGVSVFAIPADC